MPLYPQALRRHSRQISLPEVGVAGQERICAASVLVVGRADDVVAETVAMYLRATGVGTLLRTERWESLPSDSKVPQVIVATGQHSKNLALAAWCRSGGVHLVAVAARALDLAIAVSRHGAATPPGIDQGGGAPGASDRTGAVGVLAGTLAASEVIWLLAGRDLRTDQGAASQLRFRFDDTGGATA